MNLPAKKDTQSKKKLLIGLAVAVLLIASAGVAYAYFHKDNNAAEKYGSDTANPSDDTPKNDNNQSSGSPSISSPKNDGTSQSDTDTPATPDTSVKPSDPIGTFVSNHNPNLSGSPHPNTINSTCTTTAGVMCYIKFVKGSEVHTLPAQKTDASGNTAWNWKLSDIGLGEGSWSITAIAQNGAQQSTASDPTPLKVEP